MTTAIQEAPQVRANRIGAVITSATAAFLYQQSTGSKLSEESYAGPAENRPAVRQLLEQAEGTTLEGFNEIVADYLSAYLPGIDTDRMGAIVEAANEPTAVSPSFLEIIGETVKPYEDPQKIGIAGLEYTPPSKTTLKAINAELDGRDGRNLYFSADKKVLKRELPTNAHRYVLVRNKDLNRVPQGWEKASPEEAATAERLSRLFGKKESLFNGLWVETAENAAGVCVLHAFPDGVLAHSHWLDDTDAVLFRVPESQSS